MKGKADLDDADKGKLRVRVDDQGTAKTEITSERRQVTVDQNLWFGTMGALKVDADVATYKFEVENIKRLEGNCTSAAVARQAIPYPYKSAPAV